MLLIFCDVKHLYITITWSRKAAWKKITYGSGCNNSAIDLCIMGKVDSKLSNDVKVITGELQHNLVIVDVDRKKRKQRGSLKDKNKMYQH